MWTKIISLINSETKKIFNTLTPATDYHNMIHNDTYDTVQHKYVLYQKNNSHEFNYKVQQ